MFPMCFFSQQKKLNTFFDPKLQPRILYVVMRDADILLFVGWAGLFELYLQIASGVISEIQGPGFVGMTGPPFRKVGKSRAALHLPVMRLNCAEIWPAWYTSGFEHFYNTHTHTHTHTWANGNLQLFRKHPKNGTGFPSRGCGTLTPAHAAEGRARGKSGKWEFAPFSGTPV